MPPLNNKKVFDDYFETIFKDANPVTKENFDKSAKMNHYLLSDFLSENKNAKILYIGCGMGHFLYYLASYRYTNFYGIDISKQQIRFIKEGIHSMCPELSGIFKEISKKVEVADAYEFLKKNELKFDVIVALDIIEHLPKERIIEFLELVNRSLVPNGIFIAKTGNLANPFSIGIRYGDFTHELGFTDRSLVQILRMAKFREVAVYPYKGPRTFMKEIVYKFRIFAIRFISRFFGLNDSKIFDPLILCIGKK